MIYDVSSRYKKIHEEDGISFVRKQNPAAVIPRRKRKVLVLTSTMKNLVIKGKISREY